MERVKKLPKRKIVRYFVADIAKGLFNGMIGNYLLYVYQPTAKSGLPSLLPDNKLLGFITIMAILTGISKIVDAVTDPLVASLSDKCRSKNGRRMPFLRAAAIPYALCVFLVFLAPFEAGSVGNAVWVGVFLVLYYVFYTIFYIPHRALVVEAIPDSKERVGVYALSTVFFMGSSAVMYATSLFVSWFKAAGLSALTAWRFVFLIFTLVGMVCLLVSAFAFNEKDYVKGSVRPRESLFASFRVVFRNKQFVVFTLGDLCNYISMAFFQTTMLYYVTVLINIPESQAFVVMAVAIAAAILFFPLITKLCRKYNKKTPLLVGSWMFTVLFLLIYFGDSIATLFVGKELVLGVLMGLVVSYPFAAINIIPQAVVSDIIQADSLTAGTNREGFYSATKTFIEKIASAVAMIIVSSVLAVGAAEGEEVGLQGVKLTGIFAGGFSLLSAVFFTLYRDKAVTKSIEEGLANRAERALFTGNTERDSKSQASESENADNAAKPENADNAPETETKPENADNASETAKRGYAPENADDTETTENLENADDTETEKLVGALSEDGDNAKSNNADYMKKRANSEYVDTIAETVKLGYAPENADDTETAKLVGALSDDADDAAKSDNMAEESFDESASDDVSETARSAAKSGDKVNGTASDERSGTVRK